MANTTTAPPVDRQALARAATRGLDRIMWQRISPKNGTSVVAGVRHRRPAYLTVTLAAAAGLVEAGIPTVVSGYESES